MMLFERIKLVAYRKLFGQTPMYSLGVILKNRFPPGSDLRQVGSGASLTFGTPVTLSCSVNRGMSFL